MSMPSSTSALTTLEKAFFEVSNYRMATVALAQTSLRGIIGDMELDEVLYNRDMINTKLRDILDRETDQWGVKARGSRSRRLTQWGGCQAGHDRADSSRAGTTPQSSALTGRNDLRS